MAMSSSSSVTSIRKSGLARRRSGSCIPANPSPGDAVIPPKPKASVLSDVHKDEDVQDGVGCGTLDFDPLNGLKSQVDEMYIRRSGRLTTNDLRKRDLGLRAWTMASVAGTVRRPSPGFLTYHLTAFRGTTQFVPA